MLPADTDRRLQPHAAPMHRLTLHEVGWGAADFEHAFRELGLPERIRTDNGTPFASRGAGGLSQLSIWWVKIGIRHERIQPGHPEQNGRHERMHRTLKQECVAGRRPFRRSSRAAGPEAVTYPPVRDNMRTLLARRSVHDFLKFPQ